MIVLLDNGHGKETPGKRSPDGTLREGVRVRELAYATYITLCRRAINCKLLVPEDYDVPLSERVKRANSYKDAILVSIHINASGSDGKWHNPNYWSAWTTVGKTKADELAEFLYLSALSHFPGMMIGKDGSDGDMDKEENFYILKHTTCPAVLTENFFMDNRAGCEYLKSAIGLQAISEMHADGIERYLKYAMKYW